MTEDHKSVRDENMDSVVSNAYHDVANEAAPGELNRAVLRASRKALGKRTGPGWQATWFRPVASAAVIALSLAVMLEFNDASNPDSPINGGNEVIRLDDSADVFREAADSAAEQLREAEATARSATQNSAPDDSPAMGAGAQVNESLLQPIDGGCDEAQRATMSTWWECIESLENRGASALAEQELTALLGSYPAFIKPGQ